MEFIEQYYEIERLPEDLLQSIEKAGRTCYKTENKITENSAVRFVEMLRNKNHSAMIEFGDIRVKFYTDRGVSHEMVRHRLCSFAQESTRYVNYGGKHIRFIKPIWTDIKPGIYTHSDQFDYNRATNRFMANCLNSETDYNELLSEGWRAEQARQVLNNALKTEIVVKTNLTEWRHIFSLRARHGAHPQMIALMKPLLEELKTKVPVVFDDL